MFTSLFSNGYICLAQLSNNNNNNNKTMPTQERYLIFNNEVKPYCPKKNEVKPRAPEGQGIMYSCIP